MIEGKERVIYVMAVITPTQIRIEEILHKGILFDAAYPEEMLEFKPEIIEGMEEAKRISKAPNVKGYTDIKRMFKEILEEETES